MKETNRIYELMAKELTSANTWNEKESLYHELSQDPEIEYKYRILEQYWKNILPQKQNHNIISKTEKKLDFTYGRDSKFNMNLFLRIAAVVVFILSLGFSTYQVLKPKQKLGLNEYNCTTGEIKKITLTDGTKVWLNSGSYLVASEPFVGDTREVKLFGEAYFEVEHNENQPFIVKTTQLKTKVLGTHFNIVAYPTDEVQEISLYEGSVQLNAENDDNTNIKLKPGDKALFSSKNRKIKVITTDLGKPAQWRDGILRFYNEDLLSITKKLERKYHTRIFISDSVTGKLKYTGEFEEETLDQVLTLLQEAHSFTYKKTDSGIIIETDIKTI